MQDLDNTVIYAADLDGTGSMHAVSRGDPGATAYYKHTRVRMRMNAIIEAAQRGDLEAVEEIAKLPII